MTRRRNLLASLVTVLAAVGCAEDRTEIVVVVDSDYSVPGEMSSVRIEVTGPDDEMQSAQADLAEKPLPRTLGLVHRGGPLGPFEVVASGHHGGTRLVERRATVAFRKGETLMLHMLLLARCGAECPSLSEDDLQPWPGQAPGLDGGAGPMDGGADGGPGADAGPDDAGPPSDTGPADTGPADTGIDGCAAAESCNELDDDCDGAVDEGFDLDSDPDNCGECGNRCTPPFCSGGMCTGPGG